MILGGVFAFLPTWDWFFNFFKDRDSTISQLLVTTPKSTAKIYIDDQVRGTTQTDKEFAITGISKGSHKIKIARISDPSGFYQDFEKTLDFIPGTAVQVVWSAGPSTESSSGIIKYFKKQIASSTPQVKVYPYPADSAINFDDAKSDSSIVLNDTKKHTMKISKEKYISQEVPIQMTDSNGTLIKDYDLVVEVYLYQVPVSNL